MDIYVINYGNHINDWLEDILFDPSLEGNLISGIRQYQNLIQQMTGRIGKIREDVKSMINDITPAELMAVNELSRIFNSSDYKGSLLYSFFKKIENSICGSLEYNISSNEKYSGINYTDKNCKLWFDQISNKNNPKIKRNIIGCVFESVIEPDLVFLIIVATDYLHYGFLLEGDNGFLENFSFDGWQVRKKWPKINKDWVSVGVGDFRSWNKISLSLLSTNHNSNLDSFIVDRLNEFNQIVKNYQLYKGL